MNAKHNACIHEWKSHSTPLLRQLRTLDMQLQHNKITSLKLASACVNGIVFLPGETFSYWRTIGKPTYVKGCKDGLTLFRGTLRSGAICVYNYRGLMIRNDTPHAFKLSMALADTRLVGRWLADVKQYRQYEIYEQNHMLQSEGYGRYSRNNEIWHHVTTMDGELIADELVAENHPLMMHTPFLTDGLNRTEQNTERAL